MASSLPASATQNEAASVSQKLAPAGVREEASALLFFGDKAVVSGAAPEETVIVTETISPGVTPASDGRASPSFSRPASEPPTLQRSALEGLALDSLLGISASHSSEPTAGSASRPTLCRTASEMAGIHSLMGLASSPSTAKRSLVDTGSTLPPSKKLCSTDVTVEQLKLVAAAFHLCPEPTDTQMQAIATRVGLAPERVAAWFAARNALQGWVIEQKRLHPSVVSSDLVAAVWRRCISA